MALTSFLRSLTAPLRGVLPAIGGAIRRGIGLDRITKAVTDVFRGVAEIDPRNVQRAVRRLAETRVALPDLSKLGKRSRPNPRRMPIAITDIATDYSYVVLMTGKRVLTGETDTWYQTVISDENLTRDQIESAALETAEGSADKYPYDQITARLTEAVRNERLAV